jgi:hypothetical protein
MFAVFLMSVATASAVTIYDSIDNPLPGSYPSLGYQATSTSEFGDHVLFAGAERDLLTVTVTMTNWACENDFSWSEENQSWVVNRTSEEACLTTPESGFMHPLTVTLYEVNNSGAEPAVGALIASKTIDAFVPFRPSYDDRCPAPENDTPFGGAWYDEAAEACVHGYNVNVDFDFSGDGITLPEEVIYTVSFDTSSYGENPIGASGPYDSLNYGLSAGALVGTDVETATTFLDSDWADAYCDAGANGTGVLRRDADCWDGYVPTARFEARDDTPEIPEFGGLLAVATIGLIGTAFVVRKRA